MATPFDADQQEQRETARERVLAAARALFAEHGVSGTSLQMIADRLGVTKAAVYHQFHAKDEIVLALLEKPVGELRPLLADVEAIATRERQLQVFLPGLVEIVIANPEVVALIQTDPAVARLIRGRRDDLDVLERVSAILAGPDPDVRASAASMVFGAGLMLLGHHPLMADIGPEAIRRELPRLGRRLLT